MSFHHESGRGRLPAAVGLAVLSIALASSAGAQLTEQCGGVTVSPDGTTVLINKELDAGSGLERWAIVARLVDGNTIYSVTGNVSDIDGTPKAFLYCDATNEPDSNRVLTDQAQGGVRFQCKTLDPAACQGKLPAECTQDWQPAFVLAEPVPQSFFLPKAQACPARDGSDTGAKSVVVSYKGEDYLVNKPVGNERWTVSLTRPIGQKTFEQAAAVGNVFSVNTAGEPRNPQFVHCTPTVGLDVNDPQQRVPFDCQGADACEGTLAECRGRWTPLGTTSPLDVSFFLPVDGPTLEDCIKAMGGIDPRFCPGCGKLPPECVVVLGGTTQERVAGACQEGAPCSVPVPGCGTGPIDGQLATLGDGRCFCVFEIPQECRSCDALGKSSGDACTLTLGDGVGVAGVCRPETADTGRSFCVAPEVADETSCGGVDGFECDSGQCCRGDDADGCEEIGDGVQCDGICETYEPHPAVRHPCDDYLVLETCGDGTKQPSEECDDGNKVSGDDCAESCVLACRPDQGPCGPPPTTFAE